MVGLLILVGVLVVGYVLLKKLKKKDVDFGGGFGGDKNLPPKDDEHQQER